MSSFSRNRRSLIWLACLSLVGCPVDERALELRTGRPSAGSAGTGGGYAGLTGSGAEGGYDDAIPFGGAGTDEGGGAGEASLAGSSSGGSAGVGGSSGSAGQGSSQAGAAAGGEGGASAEFGCGDLDRNQVPDCDETLAQNAGFDTSDASWLADAAMTQSWKPDNARPGFTSGSMLIVNSKVLDQDGVVAGGSGQCLVATGDTTYQVAARAFLAAGQGQGSASVALWFYGADSCSNYLLGSKGPSPVATTDTWTVARGVVKSPPATRSMRIVLQASKPFRQAKLEARFDDVLVHAQ